MSTWIKLYDNFWRNPKVLAAGEDAAGLYIQGLCFCSSHLSDGWIPEAALRVLTTRPPAKAKRLAAVLVEVGLWDLEPGGWHVHDYEEHQRTKAEVEKLRARANRRASIHRNPALKAAIRGRDGNECRYCGRAVDWTNRRGPMGATYDHVDPDGPDTLDNLVVACRGCNSAKRNRTPGQAGMDLLPIRSVSSTDLVPDQNADLPETDTDTETDNPPLTPPGPEVDLEHHPAPLTPEEARQLASAELPSVRAALFKGHPAKNGNAPVQVSGALTNREGT